jgi:uncharacterized damage-inducible protein DinB
MIRRIDDFIDEWEQESARTRNVLERLTDESLGFRPGDMVRSIGRLAWHIVQTLEEMPHTAGLESIGSGLADSPIPDRATEIRQAYDRGAAAVASVVREHWTDPMLEEKVRMYGEEWPRGVVLSALIRHEIHHRAQLTVLMRMAGLPVPGCYGPSREEWAAFGAAPME